MASSALGDIESSIENLIAMNSPTTLSELTVVIATKNRPRDIERVLHSLLKQRTLPAKIIVVDQSDEPYKIAAHPMIEHIYDPTIRGLTRARNVGIKAIGDAAFCLFLDDDIEVISNLALEIPQAFYKHPEAVGIQCNVEDPNSKIRKSSVFFASNRRSADLWIIWKRIFYRGFFDNRLGPIRSDSDELARVHGCAMAFSANIFATELFDENLTEYSLGEDWDFSRRASRLGKFFLAPAALVIHHESEVNRYRRARLMAQRWKNFRYFYANAQDRRPQDVVWRLWWMFGETLLWLKGGLGLPSDKKSFPK